MPIPAGQPAPNLSVSTWVQGAATNLDQQRGNMVLIEVFQVDCGKSPSARPAISLPRYRPSSMNRGFA